MSDQRPGKGLVIFVSGPSGVGKSTVCRRLTTLLPAQFAPSATTRAGKKQDAYGKEYHFVDEAEFRRLIEARAFLEYAFIYGNWYGTLHQPVHDAIAEGRTIVLEIDVQGAIQVHKLFPHSMGVFILPPSMEDLERRLRERARDDEATIQRRLAEAQQEIRTGQTCGAYDLMVVNEDHGVEKTAEAIKRAMENHRGDHQIDLF